MNMLASDDLVENYFELIAAVYWQAVADAKAGNREAIQFIREIAPNTPCNGRRKQRRTLPCQANP